MFKRLKPDGKKSSPSPICLQMECLLVPRSPVGQTHYSPEQELLAEDGGDRKNLFPTLPGCVFLYEHLTQ